MRPNEPRTNRRPSRDPDLTIRVLLGRGLAVIRLGGEVGLDNGGHFEAALLTQADRIETDTVLDLTELTYINVIGLGIIVRLGNALRARGCRLALFGAAPHICKLIRTVRLHEVFPPLALADTIESPTHAGELAICA